MVLDNMKVQLTDQVMEIKRSEEQEEMLVKGNCSGEKNVFFLFRGLIIETSVKTNQAD